MNCNDNQPRRKTRDYFMIEEPMEPRQARIVSRMETVSSTTLAVIIPLLFLTLILLVGGRIHAESGAPQNFLSRFLPVPVLLVVAGALIVIDLISLAVDRRARQARRQMRSLHSFETNSWDETLRDLVARAQNAVSTIQWCDPVPWFGDSYYERDSALWSIASSARALHGATPRSAPDYQPSVETLMAAVDDLEAAAVAAKSRKDQLRSDASAQNSAKPLATIVSEARDMAERVREARDMAERVREHAVKK